ncbi:MAG: crotonase/enoyl-CoA hydratase family protein [Pseudomonadota bacterium]
MLDYQLQGDVAIATLDDGKANAVGHTFIDAVDESLQRANTEAKAICLVGRQGVFSGGFDLKELQKGEQEREALVRRGAELLLRIFMHPQPVVVACTGHAVAAGAFVLLSADTRIGALGDYKIGLNETAIGLTLPVFGFELSKARLSPRYHSAAVTQAQLYDASQAMEVGFIDSAVALEEVVSSALEHAASLSEIAGDAYAYNKTGIRQSTADAIAASLN